MRCDDCYEMADDPAGSSLSKYTFRQCGPLPPASCQSKGSAGKRPEAAAGRLPGQYHGGSAGLPGRRPCADDNQKGALPMGFHAAFQFEGPVEISSGMVKGGG